MEVCLPNYYWFKNPIDAGRSAGNVYSGSLGTDPQKGGLNVPTFNYKVSIAKEKESGEVTFSVSCFVQLGWDKRGEKVDGWEATFPDGEEGLKQVRDFLNTALAESPVGNDRKRICRKT